MNKISKIAHSIVLLCTVFVITHVTFGQANAVDGAMNGYITDSTGAALPGAAVSALNTATNIAQQTRADAQGYYRFSLLPVGTYQITVSAPSFGNSVRQGIVLNVGQTARVDVTMEVTSTSTSVNVEGDTVSMVDTGNATVGAVLDRHQVESLPLPSRNIYNFLLLSPGVIGVPTSNFGTTQFTFGGTERSQWNLDGLDDTQHGGARQIRMIIVMPEAVAQTQTLANGYSAEFGRAAGGQINVLTKSGTNQFHGSAIYQYRPLDLQAIPTLAHAQTDRSWHDEGGTIGGPILRDRLFFFGEFENNPYISPNTITITSANATALGLPASEVNTAPFGETYRTIVAKVDYSLNAKNSGYIRYARFTNHQPGNASGLIITSRGLTFLDHMNGGGVQLATIFSPNVLNELRFGTIQRDQGNQPLGSTTNGNVAINITSVANIGYNPLAATATTERSTDLIDNLTWTRGRSTWKFGAEFEHILFATAAAQDQTYVFNGLAASGAYPAVSALNQYLNTKNGTINPATGQPYTYTYYNANGGNPKLRIAFNHLSAFAQNEFRVTRNFSINAGVRYEVLLFPTLDPLAPYPASRSVNTDYSDFAPRIAVTWSPTESRGTVVHAAYGMYYDIPGLSTFYTAAQINGHRFLSYQVAGGATGAPIFPNIGNFSGSTFQVKPNITAFDSNFHNAYQHQANVQIQRELSHGLQVTVGYQFAALRHGLYYTDVNLTPTGAFRPDGRAIYAGTSARPNKSFAAINTIHSEANTNFNGLFASVTESNFHGLTFTANYMYSHALADNLGEGGGISDPANLHRDYGNTENDVRHNLVVQGIYTVAKLQGFMRWANGFEFSSTTYLNSGMPINVLAGTDLNQDGLTNDRPDFVTRDSRRGYGLSDEDLQVKRYFTLHEKVKLSVFALSENLLNTNNLNCTTTTGCSSSVINTATAADFGRQTSARTSRTFQLGTKLTF